MVDDTVKYGQSKYDFCVEKYGTIQQVAQLTRDNSLIYDVDITQGLELEYETDLGNEDIKDFFVRNSIIPVSNVQNEEILYNFIFKSDTNFIFKSGANFIFKKT